MQCKIAWNGYKGNRLCADSGYAVALHGSSDAVPTLAMRWHEFRSRSTGSFCVKNKLWS